MKIRYYRLYKLFYNLFFYSILFASILILSQIFSNIVLADTYTPAAPIGPDKGLITIEYNYTIYTTSSDGEWMFDWGDGEKSGWISLQESEKSITLSHSWGFIGEYQIRVKFKNNHFPDGVWSDPIYMIISDFTEGDSPEIPIIISGIIKGCENVEYYFSTYATDPNNDNVQYRFDFGDETISDWTELVSSGTTSKVNHIWEKIGEYKIKSQARDRLGLTSEWSEVIDVLIEPDTDLDGVSDNVETELGSIVNDESDITKININEQDYFIVSISGEITLLYNPYHDYANLLKKNDANSYLIDVDDNKKWDYVYNPIDESIISYEKSLNDASNQLFLIIGIISIIAGIIITILILIKKGYIYLYEEEIIIEE